MTRFKPVLIPLLLFVASFLLRLTFVSKGPYHADCIFLALQAQKTALTLHPHFLHGHGYPLTALMGAVFVGIGRILGISDPVRMVNLMNVVFSSLAVPALYCLVRRLFRNDDIALFSAGLFSLSPIFLTTSVYGNSHGLSLFFMLCGLAALLAYLETGRLAPLVLAGAGVGLSGAARLGDAAVMIVPLTAFIVLGRGNDPLRPPVTRAVRVRDYFLFVVTLLATTGLFYGLIRLYNTDIHLSRDFPEIVTRQVVIRAENIGIALMITARYLLENFSLMGVLAGAAGFVLMWTRDRRAFWMLALWFIVPTLLMGSTMTAVPRYFIVSIVPVYIALGFLWSGLMRHRALFRAAALMVAGALVYAHLGLALPLVRFRHEREVMPDYLRWISRVTEENAVVIFPDATLPLSYYAQRQIFPRPCLISSVGRKALRDFRQRLDRALAEGIPVYATESGLESYDLDGGFERFMRENYRLEKVGAARDEGWHQGALYLKVGFHALFRVFPKEK